MTAVDPLRQLEMALSEGHRGAILEALAVCAQAGMPMPRWLADEVQCIFREVLSGRASDLNEAFGLRAKDPRTRSRRHRVMEHAAQVGNLILCARAAGRPIDDELLAVVAEKADISLRLARECWRACRAEAERFGVAIEDLEPGAFRGRIRPAR